MADEQEVDPATAPEAEGQEPQPTAFASLSAEAKKALEGMLKSALHADRSGRRQEVRKTWKLRDYCRGRQHCFYDKRSYLFISPEASGQELPMHMATYDITTPHKRSFVSILSENPPGVNFVPNDLAHSADVTSAKNAEKMRARVDRLVQMRERQQKVAGLLCTDGRVVTWVRVDERGRLIVDVRGVLEAKVPLYSEGVEDWDFCVLSREVSIWKAKSDFPDDADKISATDSGSGEAVYERFARLAIVSSSRGGDLEALRGLTTEHWCWIRPWRYRKVADNVRKEIEAAFPSGVRIHAFGSAVVDAIDEGMDALSVEFPVDDEGQVRPALLSGVPDIQDAYNDIKNMMREVAEYGIPATWIDKSSGVDLEAIAEQRSEPGAVHGIAPANGKSVADSVFQEQPAVISPQVVAMLPELKQDAEFTTGDFPALYGGDTPGQDTVGVNKLLNNQAKGQLGPAWSAIQRLWAKVYSIAIPLAAELAQGPITIEGANGQDTVDPQAILAGSFTCHPDQDSSFPETTADKRAAFVAFQTYASSLGAVGNALLTHPRNVDLALQLGGLKNEIENPQGTQYDVQTKETEILLREPAIPPDQVLVAQWRVLAAQAAASGQTPPPEPQGQPSVSIQPRDDHAIHILSAEDALNELRRGGMITGLQEKTQNLQLHIQAHESAQAAAAQANAPKPDAPRVSLSAKVTDPVTIAGWIADTGSQTTPQNIEASTIPEQQNLAADTASKAANAQHKTVLAVRESIAPHHTFTAPMSGAPDETGGLDAR